MWIFHRYISKAHDQMWTQHEKTSLCTQNMCTHSDYCKYLPYCIRYAEIVKSLLDHYACTKSYVILKFKKIMWSNLMCT